jgi:hypothetical protein
MKEALIKRIEEYLSGGGLFNPEMANHIAVRDLLIECRIALAQPEQKPVAWLQIGVGPLHEGDVIARTTKPKEWNSEWWKFEPLYTTPPQRKPLTDEMVVAAARVLNELQADACGVDRDDQWAIYSDDFKADALAMLKAAHGIKG